MKNACVKNVIRSSLSIGVMATKGSGKRLNEPARPEKRKWWALEIK